MDLCCLVPDALRSAFGYNPGVTNPPAPRIAAPDSTAAAVPKRSQVFSFDWLRYATPPERKSLIAGGLGWMLDAMDVMLYSLVLAFLIREFTMDTRTAGLLNSLTLIASGIGGLLFGVLADRIGRIRSLMAAILLYALATAACGFPR